MHGFPSSINVAQSRPARGGAAQAASRRNGRRASARSTRPGRRRPGPVRPEGLHRLPQLQPPARRLPGPDGAADARQPGADRNNTDPWMACNAHHLHQRQRQAAGRPDSYINGDPLGPRPRRSRRCSPRPSSARWSARWAGDRSAPPATSSSASSGCRAWSAPRDVVTDEERRDGARAQTNATTAEQPALRLQGAAARRHLGDRALSPQRLGADALRSAAAAGPAAEQLQRRHPRI